MVDVLTGAEGAEEMLPDELFAEVDEVELEMYVVVK